jgi:CRISPR-associated protein Cmr6
MNRSIKNNQDSHPNSPQDIWKEFLESLGRRKPPPGIYSLLKESQIAGISSDQLKLTFPTEQERDAAKAKLGKIKKEIPLSLQRHRIDFQVGAVPMSGAESSLKPQIKQSTRPDSRNTQSRSPLMDLLIEPFGDERGQEVSQPILQKAVEADKTCQEMYAHLTRRTQKLAQDTLTIKFPWRLRVGGIRGFRDLLLPAFHPVYGIPYIPASSLKGSVRAWARSNHYASEAEDLFGTLKKGMGKVEILDAFPTHPCLSVDMANPQWHWRDGEIKYNPEPHALLTLERPELIIGLRPTSRGTAADVKTVKDWLRQALSSGIGSRVSAGYGRAGMVPHFPYSSTYTFNLWSQGIYGADPPSKANEWRGQVEFRPVAIRGMLRYWFRTLGLGFYDHLTCRQIDKQLFGDLGQEGSIYLSVEWDTQEENPFCVQGTILLESKVYKHLQLVEKLLFLGSHLGGIGRGARRPLHCNSGRLRGCHWELTANQLPMEKEPWQEIFAEIEKYFISIHELSQPDQCPPFRKGSRLQDVLNSNARVYLCPDRVLKHPQEIDDYKKEGYALDVRGKALELLYGSDKFKGVNRDGKGNSRVGGQISYRDQPSIPSYVLIKSNYPEGGLRYQTVTIFGSDYPDRNLFAREIEEISELLIWPPSNARHKSIPTGRGQRR